MTSEDVQDLKLDMTMVGDDGRVFHEKFRSPDYLLGLAKKPSQIVWHRDKKDCGEGVCGAVYGLSHEGLAEKRALKLIRKRFLKTTVDKNIWIQELKALTVFSLLKHQDTGHFVNFYGWFDTEDEHCLIMDYFPLGNLENVVGAGETLPEAQTITIAIQILRGLEIMHKLNFVHRDLKPQNILVAEKGPNWWIRLADFGFTKEQTIDTQMKSHVGTPLYRAPEMIALLLDDDSDGSYNELVDIWSAGCVMFRLLAGNVPFADDLELKKYCLQKSEFPTEKLEANASSNAISVLQDMLKVDPKVRISACDALKTSWLQPAASRHPPRRKPRNSTCLTRDINSQERLRAIALVKNRIGNDSSSRDAIHEASIRGDVEMVRCLLQVGVDSDISRRIEGSAVSRTPIVSAVAENSDQSWTQIAEMLLEGGCDVNAFSQSDGETALHAACRMNAEQESLERLEWLLAHGAAPALRSYCQGMNPLHIASQQGYCYALQLFLQEKLEVDERAITPVAPTALHLAIDRGHVEMVTFLLSRGANLSITTRMTQRTPIHVAIIGLEQYTPNCTLGDSEKIVECLLHNPEIRAAIIVGDGEGMTPLEYVAKFNLDTLAVLLIEACLLAEGQFDYQETAKRAYKIAWRDDNLARLLEFLVSEEDKNARAKAMRPSKLRDLLRKGKQIFEQHAKTKKK